MQTRNIRLRIARLEQTANVHRKHEHDCVCFPEREPPFFCSPWEEELAAKVKCPLHGSPFWCPRPGARSLSCKLLRRTTRRFSSRLAIQPVRLAIRISNSNWARSASAQMRRKRLRQRKCRKKSPPSQRLACQAHNLRQKGIGRQSKRQALTFRVD
jgi:hypothetical protein